MGSLCGQCPTSCYTAGDMPSLAGYMLCLLSQWLLVSWAAQYALSVRQLPMP